MTGTDILQFSSPLHTAVVLVALQAVSFVLGLRLARLRLSQGVNVSESLSIIAAGILGLTAFVLALTLSLATTRMQERRQEGWTEANAIHGSWELALLVGGPEVPRIVATLKTYAELRRESLRLDEGDPRITEIADQVTMLQTDLTVQVAAILARRSDDLTSSLAVSLKDLFAATNQQRLAVANQMPLQINLLMLVLVFAGMGVIGHQVGMTGQSHPILTLTLIGIWTYIVILILDFGDSRAGTFRTSTEAYEMVLEQMNARPALPSG